MRFSFYTSLTVAALLASKCPTVTAIDLSAEEGDNSVQLAQLQTWSMEDEQDLAQIYRQDGGDYDAQELAETNNQWYSSSDQSDD